MLTAAAMFVLARHFVRGITRDYRPRARVSTNKRIRAVCTHRNKAEHYGREKAGTGNAQTSLRAAVQSSQTERAHILHSEQKGTDCAHDLF
jgi:hypothetical protein